MNPMLSEKNPTYPSLIASFFSKEKENAYNQEWIENEFQRIKSLFKKDEQKFTLVNSNTEYKCFICGQIHPKGVKAPAENILKKNMVFSPNFNETYSFAKETKNGIAYICFPCLYLLKNKKKNFVVTEKEFRIIKANKNTENEMYEYLVEPFKKPFIMAINTRGTVTEFMSHLAIPTISNEIMAVVFGQKVLYVEKSKLLNCLEDVDRLEKQFDISNIKLFANKDKKGWRFKVEFSQKNRDKDGYIKEIGAFYANYNQETRLLAEKLFPKYKLKKGK